MIELEIADLQAPVWTLRPLSQVVVTELVRSIRTAGLLQPVVVRPSSKGYEVVFGNHRLEACRRLGLSKVRVLIRRFTEEQAFLARLSENLLRNSFVDPLEEARGYSMLVEKGWTINAIGEMVGKCDSYICERMALLDRLSERVQSEVSQGLIPASHAELISRVRDPGRQSEIAQLVRKKKLSVRALENLINGLPSPTRIQVQVQNDEYYLKIPREFAKAIGMEAGRHLYLYIRGKRKIVIENLSRRVNCKPQAH